MSGVKLRRVNYDSSWLVTIRTDPIYRTSTFNLLIDPWLDESEQVDYHATFSGQKRTTPALASSIHDLESLLEREGKEEDDVTEKGEHDERLPSRRIDAIVFSHPFTDHMHPPTLNDESVTSGRIPLFVTLDARPALETILGGKKKIESKYINIIEMTEAKHHKVPAFLQSGSNTKSSSLPSNLEILQVLPQERFSPLAGPAGIAWGKLHGGVIILWKESNPNINKKGPTSHHSILYSPHGISRLSTPFWLKSTHAHAIMTSLDKIVLPKWLSGVVNLGLPAAIDLIKEDVFQADYILATHDERKEAKGLVASLIKRYWLGQTSPDAQNHGLTKLKQRDECRQQEGQSLVNAALGGVVIKPRVLVLDVGQTLLI
ncbi:hypothetical protein CBS101457_004757 [Exobasidium rhododendri]|nr:hypothetical protein CBS101457_004757 [Exobasidium rhododendri]